MQVFRSTLFRFGVILVSLTTIVTVAFSLVDLWRRKDTVHSRKDVLSGLENIRLKKQLEEAQSPDFVERQARDKLGFAREGETVVLLPKPTIATESEIGEEKEETPLPSWKKWWKLFF